MDRARLFFDHISKTAGTSLQRFFVDGFGENKVTPTVKGQKLQSVLTMYGDRRVITGHFGFIPEDRLPERWVAATVLRNPRERLLSEYYYIFFDVPDFGCGPNERRIKRLSLEDGLYDAEFSEHAFNYQSVHFASFFHPTPGKLPASDLLRLAKQGLEQYQLVGTTERLGEFTEEIKRIFDLPEHVCLKRCNVTSRRLKFDELPLRIQERIDELTSVDRELWRYADFLFDSCTRHFVIPGLAAHDGSLGPQQHHSGEAPVECVVEDGSLELLSVVVKSEFRAEPAFLAGEQATVQIAFRALKDLDDLTIGYSLHHDAGFHLFGTNTRLMGRKLSVAAGGEYRVDFAFPVNLGIGGYFVSVSAHSGLTHLERCYLWREKVASFAVDGFLDVPFEGMVRLMPSVQTGRLSLQGWIESETVSATVQRVGLDTPAIDDASGFIRLARQVEESLNLRSGEQVSIPVEVTNQGRESWITEGNSPIYLSYHVLNTEGEVISFDGARTPLPCREIKPGETVPASVMVEAPKEEGEFILELTMVQEFVCWFEEKGFKSARLRANVGC